MAEKPSARRFVHDAAAFAHQNVNVIVLAVVAVIFIAILQEVAEGEITRLDTLAYQFFVVRLRSDWLTPVMDGFSSLASPAVSWASAASSAYRSDRLTPRSRKMS